MPQPILFKLQRPIRAKGFAPLVARGPLIGPSSSSGAFTPNSVAGLQAWYDADSESGADGSNHDTLTDLKGTYTATNVNSALENAKLRYNAQNGRKAVEFASPTGNAVQMNISGGLLNGATAGSYFCVVKSTADPPASGSFAGAFVDGFGTSGSSCHHPYTDGHFYDDFGATTRPDYGDPTPSFSSSYRIFSVQIDASGNKQIYIDGTLFNSSTGLTVGFGTGTRRLFYNAAPAVQLGFLAEMLFYNTSPVTADRESIEGYLAHRWFGAGAANNLPSGHTYKNTPPGGATLNAYTLTCNPGSYAITGTATGLLAARTLALAPGSYAVTGTATRLLRGYRLPITPGAYTISGVATGAPAIARRLAAAVGSYTLTGVATRLLRGRYLAAAVGSYAISGQTVNLSYGRRAPLVPGSYTISGQATGLLRGKRLAAAVGSYSIAGQAVGLNVARRLALVPGAYALTGQAVNLSYTPLSSYSLSAASGSYVLTGTATALRRTRQLAAAAGAYVIVGNPLGFLATRRLQLAPGAYAITGNSVALAHIVRTLWVRHNAPASVGIGWPPSPAPATVTAAVAPSVTTLDAAAVSPLGAFTKAAAPGAVDLE